MIGGEDVDEEHEPTAWANFLEACCALFYDARWLGNLLLGRILPYGLCIFLLYVMFRKARGLPFVCPIWLERVFHQDVPEHIRLEWQLRADYRAALLRARRRWEDLV